MVFLFLGAVLNNFNFMNFLDNQPMPGSVMVSQEGASLPLKLFDQKLS